MVYSNSHNINVCTAVIFWVCLYMHIFFLQCNPYYYAINIYLHRQIQAKEEILMLCNTLSWLQHNLEQLTLEIPSTIRKFANS